MESPVQRNVCGFTVDAIESHIVGDSVAFDLDMRLLKAPREWQDPNAIRDRMNGVSTADDVVSTAVMAGRVL